MWSAAGKYRKGAFRFTTTAITKLHSRDVSVKVAGATIGIRGTDVWGKAGGKTKIATMEKAMGKSLNRPGQDTLDFDVVCLIEGRIDVTHNNEATFVMDQAQTFYVMPKNETPLPVSALSTEQLDKWVAETEIAANQGAARNGGKWKVNLLTASSEHDALAAYDELHAAGYAARIQPLSDGQYQLRIMQLPSRAEAGVLAHELTGKMGVVIPTVGR